MESYSLFLNSSNAQNRQFASGSSRNDITYYVNWEFLPTEFSKYEVSYYIQSISNLAIYSAPIWASVRFGSTDVVSQKTSSTSIVCPLTLRTYYTKSITAPRAYFSSSALQQDKPIIMINYPSTNYVRVQFLSLNEQLQLNMSDYMIILTFTPVKN